MDEDAKKFSNSQITDIANKLKNFEHDTWMECASSRIFSKLVKICEENEDYCKTVVDKLQDELNNADPDSSSTIAMENLSYGLTAALLKSGKIDMEKVKKQILKVSKEEIKDMSEPVKSTESETESSESLETEDEGNKKESE